MVLRQPPKVKEAAGLPRCSIPLPLRVVEAGVVRLLETAMDALAVLAVARVITMAVPPTVAQQVRRDKVTLAQTIQQGLQPTEPAAVEVHQHRGQ